MRKDSPPAVLAELDPSLRENWAVLQQIYAIGVATGEYDTRADRLGGISTQSLAAADATLRATAQAYDRRVTEAQRRATVGAGAVIVALLLAFGFLFRLSTDARRRAEDLSDENERASWRAAAPRR